MKKFGIVIFVLGLVMTVISTITFFTDEKVVNLGKVEIAQEKEYPFNISPVVGIAIMGIGGIVFWQTYNTQ